MQALKIFLLLLNIFAFTAFKSDDAHKLIARKWKIDGEELKKSVENNIKKMKKENPEQAKMAEEMMDVMISGLITMTMEFKADGTYERTYEQQTQIGTWNLSNDGKSLMIEAEDNKGKKDTIGIKKLSKKKIVLDATNPDNKTSPLSELVFIPA